MKVTMLSSKVDHSAPQYGKEGEKSPKKANGGDD